jgi:hypothetical protein
MKALGTRSISSLLTVVLTGVSYGVAVLIVVLACIIGLSFFGVTQLPNVTIDIPAQVKLDAGAYRVTAASLGIDEARLDNLTGEAELSFGPPSRGYAAAVAAAPIVVLAFALYVLTKLRAIFRTLRAGTPFVPENAHRIRKIAYAVMAGEIVQALVSYGGHRHVMSHFTASGLQFDARPELDAFPIVGGLIILVLAEVFRAGTRLDEEQSLTV